MRRFTWLHALLAGLPLLALGGFISHATAVGPIIGMAWLSLAAATLVAHQARVDRALAALLAIAYLVRVAAAVLDHTYAVFPKADQNGYFLEAKWMAEAWAQGESGRLPITYSVGAYVHLLAPFFYIFGPHVLMPRFLSAFFGMAAVCIIYHMGRRLFGGRAGLPAAVVFASLPSFIYIQSETLRDAAILVAILGAFALALDGPPRALIRWIAFSASVVAIYLLRAETLLIASVPLALLIVFGYLARRDVLPRHQSSPALSGPARPLRIGPRHLILPALAAALMFLLVGTSYVVFVADLEALAAYRAKWALGGSAYLQGIQFDSPVEFLAFIPLAAFFFLFTPFPWQIHNSLALLAAAEQAVIWYPLAALAAPGLWSHRRDLRLWVLLGFLLTGACVYGVIEGNAGTALRHRLQFTWVISFLATPLVMRGLHLPVVKRLRLGVRSPPKTRPD